MRKKIDPRRIERLEASVRSLQIEDVKRRHLESYSKMSGEEVASLSFAIKQLIELVQEDPCRSGELFRGGSSATEHLDERARLGWRRFCETGGQAALVDFLEVTEGEGAPTGTPWEVVGILFEGKPFSGREAGIRFHIAQLASDSE